MARVTQEYRIGANHFSVYLKDIPTISDATRKIVEIFRGRPPTAFSQTAKLQGRADKLSACSLTRPLWQMIKGAVGAGMLFFSLYPGESRETCRDLNGELYRFFHAISRQMTSYYIPGGPLNCGTPHFQNILDGFLVVGALLASHSVYRLLLGSYMDKKSLAKDLEKDQEANQQCVAKDFHYFTKQGPYVQQKIQVAIDMFDEMEKREGDLHPVMRAHKEKLETANQELDDLIQFYQAMEPVQPRAAAG